jgi:Luciferase-like monooxygenase
MMATPLHIGIDSFVSTVMDPVTGVDVSPVERVQHLLEEVERADQVGLDSYGIGEHHRHDFMDSAPAVLLAAAAARTTSIRLNSAVAVLSASDPVRVFQEFATLDLISKGGSTSSLAAARSPRPFRSSGLTSLTTARCSPRSSTSCCASVSRRRSPGRESTAHR